jgi:tRNA dimethylallyltransferase
MESKKKVILLAGPTASGKSQLAIKLAKKINGEIINADSMQIYKEISILTNRPSAKDEKIIKHHLYGFCSVKNFFSAGHWLNEVTKRIRTKRNNKKILIIVGGTGLYFKALTEGLAKVPEIPSNTRDETVKLHKDLGQKNFFKKLIKLDPLAKNFILATDSQRSIRAYEVKKFTNKSLFLLIKKTKPNFDLNIFKKIFINTPRELLNKKIEVRVEKMLKEGAVEEVENFLKLKIHNELSANKIIGVQEIKAYLDNQLTINQAKELIIQKTRQYAKRQFTWSRGHMKSWEKIYSPNINDLYKETINKIS